MAETRVVYAASDDDSSDFLCFICAVKRAMQPTNDIWFEIAIQSDQYNYHKCVDCDRLIHDTITI